MAVNWKLYNVIILGFAFMLVFTAFQTSSMVEESVINAAKIEPNSTFSGDGYTSLAVIYAVFAASNWVAPSIIAVIGAKLSMIIGGIIYGLFVASFLKPMTWALYTGSVLIGFAASIIWTGQGAFLTANSDKETMGRNSGLFWAMLQCSLLIGNMYEYFEFRGQPEITKAIRTKLFLVLSFLAAFGIAFMVLLWSKPPSSPEGLAPVNENRREGEGEAEARQGPMEALKTSFRMFLTTDMLLLSVCFFYTGLELTFFSGVYGTSVGNNQHFGSDAKGYIGLVGMLIGIGEISSGALFGLLGKKTVKYGRCLVVLLGIVLHTVAFFLIFINLPDDSPLQETNGATYITSSKAIALLCAFLLGFGDGSFNTQCYSILGTVYSDNSAPAFALFKFTQSIAAAAGFFYSNHIHLKYQLLILEVMGLIGTYCFWRVEWSAARHASYLPLPDKPRDTEEQE